MKTHNLKNILGFFCSISCILNDLNQFGFWTNVLTFRRKSSLVWISQRICMNICMFLVGPVLLQTLISINIDHKGLCVLWWIRVPAVPYPGRFTSLWRTGLCVLPASQKWNTLSAMLLTQVQPGTVCRVSAIQRTPEHIASLLLPCGFKRSTNQQPGDTSTQEHMRNISFKYMKSLFCMCWNIVNITGCKLGRIKWVSGEKKEQ